MKIGNKTTQEVSSELIFKRSSDKKWQESRNILIDLIKTGVNRLKLVLRYA